VSIEIRKTIVNIEDTFIEGGVPAALPLRIVVAAAVIQNPWLGGGFVRDLLPVVRDAAPPLAKLLTDLVLRQADVGDVKAFGKGAVVGTAGEIEHAAALIHSLHFGNVCRDLLGGSSYMPFSQKRTGPGCRIDVPMKNKLKENEGSRAHFLTAEIGLSDAPAPGEIVVVLAVADGGRPHHRIGDRYLDMLEMERR
jgi:hypothetical protein